MMAACRKNDLELFKKLVEMDLEVNSKDCNGRTCLHEACEKGFDEIVNILFTRSVEINEIDLCGDTPVMLAVKNKRKNITEKLVKRGADTSIPDNIGKTLKFYASKEINQILVSFAPAQRHKNNRYFIRILKNDGNGLQEVLKKKSKFYEF